MFQYSVICYLNYLSVEEWIGGWIGHTSILCVYMCVCVWRFIVRRLFLALPLDVGIMVLVSS
jgi:hypothetical protein